MRQMLRALRLDWRWLVPAIVVTLVVPIGIAQVAGAATINVNRAIGTDNPACGTSAAPCRTISYAVTTRATTGDTVSVVAGTYPEGLSIGKSLTITGAGAANTKIDGSGTNQPIKIAAGFSVTLQSLTVQNGSAVGGGGIDNAGNLSLSDVVVSGNAATSIGGGIANRAGATLNLHNVTISGNTAMTGGGIANDAGGSVSGDTSTISSNIVTDIGGAIYNRNKSTVTLTNSTISGNKIYVKGTTTLQGAGGGIDSFGATVTATNVTFAGNASSVGNDGVSTDGNFTLKNSIVADGCKGKVTSADYNIGGTPDSPCGFTGPHDQPNVNPLLGPLANNGGPTMTHALMPGSPAIDKGGTSANQCPTTDQRAIARPQGPACDIGAFELEVATTQPTAVPTATTTGGTTAVACTPLAPGSAFANDAFKAQYDQGEAITPNFWGPPGTPPNFPPEKYAEAPGGQRLVQYFDKGRMELTDPSTGTVTNGLLANELITGQMQIGNNVFQTRTPAAIPIAGDPDNPGPTYAALGGKAGSLLSPATAQIGTQVTAVVGADGTVGTNGTSMGNANITTFDDATKHNVPGVFADYRNTAGLATIGYAKSEPFLAMVKVGGVQKQVMVQVFERRVLTYTPDNPDPFKVEMGNIGQHYYKWRYCTA